jgi:hypothetical protein
MYQLNPSDFEAVYKDVVVYNMKTWQQIVEEVFGSQTSQKDTEDNKDKDKP